MMAQVMECEPSRWDLADDILCSLHIPLAALDYVAAEKGDGVSVHYRGRDVLQIYLVVLIDCLRAANRGDQ